MCVCTFPQTSIPGSQLKQTKLTDGWQTPMYQIPLRFENRWLCEADKPCYCPHDGKSES